MGPRGCQCVSRFLQDGRLPADPFRDPLGDVFQGHVGGDAALVQMPAEEILDEGGELAAIRLGVCLGNGDEEAGKIEVDRLFEGFAAFGARFGSGFGSESGIDFGFWGGFWFGHARTMRMAARGIKKKMRNLCKFSLAIV